VHFFPETKIISSHFKFTFEKGLFLCSNFIFNFVVVQTSDFIAVLEKGGWKILTISMLEAKR
jgi:hypothetical protein